MPRNMEDIIVPERRRSIRDVPIPEGRRRNERPAEFVTPREPYTPPASREDFDFPREDQKFSTPLHPAMGRSKWRGKKSVWAAALALLVLIFAILSIFNGATLTYLPKSVALSFDTDIYTAQKTGKSGLLYSVIKLSKDKGLDVPAVGVKEVQRKASGTIIVYNKAGAGPQRLRATTRFETPDGKIYQVEDAIVIPGKKVVGGVEKPGALEITVYAERPGEEFNIGLTDFTLPGLEGTSLSSSIYARSKTVMSGGFVGRESVVNSQDQAQTKTRLETALRDELISDVMAQVPADFILFPSLSSVTFEDLPQTDSAGKDSVKINSRANLFGVMFKRSELSNHLVSNKVTLASGESVDIVPLDSLNFSFVGAVPADLLLSDEIKFSVTGQATAVWLIDEVALRTDLIGRHKKDLSSILNNYQTITSATAVIRPFWKSSFPDNDARISVKKLPVK